MNIIVRNIELMRDSNNQVKQASIRFEALAEGSNAQLNGYVLVPSADYFTAASDEALLNSLVKQQLNTELA